MPLTKIEEFQKRIEAFFGEYKEVAVAFSGGCDSSLLLACAKMYCEKLKAYMVFTPFQLRADLNDAKVFASQQGVALQVIEINVLENEVLRKNPKERCYLCKSMMFSNIRAKMKDDGFEHLIDGTNLSDDPSTRPGFKALKEHGVLSPLRMCGLEKSDVRKLSEKLNLTSAKKPSFSCIATKFEYYTNLDGSMLRAKEKELLQK